MRFLRRARPFVAAGEPVRRRRVLRAQPGQAGQDAQTTSQYVLPASERTTNPHQPTASAQYALPTFPSYELLMLSYRYLNGLDGHDARRWACVPLVQQALPTALPLASPIYPKHLPTSPAVAPVGAALDRGILAASNVCHWVLSPPVPAPSPDHSARAPCSARPDYLSPNCGANRDDACRCVVLPAAALRMLVFSLSAVLLSPTRNLRGSRVIRMFSLLFCCTTRIPLQRYELSVLLLRSAQNIPTQSVCRDIA